MFYFSSLNLAVLLVFLVTTISFPLLAGGGGNSHAGCLHSYDRCSREALVQSFFPGSTNPDQELVLSDTSGKKRPFKQLASHVDNDVSDFSWDKVLFISSIGTFKPGIVWYGNYSEVQNFNEGAHITALEPEKSRFVATIAHWPHQKEGVVASLWLIVKSKGPPVPNSWYANPEKDRHKRYVAHIIHYWRINPPNCPALGGPVRMNGKSHPGECHHFEKPPLHDNEGEMRRPSWKGRLLDSLGFSHELRIPPLQGFLPKGGEVVGFMFSGYHNAMGVHSPKSGERPTIEERTNIVWYKLPSADGSIPGGVVDCHSDVDAPCVDGNNISDPIDPPVIVDPEPEPPGGGSSNSGSCGNAPNTCLEGDFHGHPPDTISEHLWTCRNRPHNGEVSCRASRSQFENNENLGACGGIVNTCSGGDFHPHPPETTREIIWTCRNREVKNDRHTGEIRCALNPGGEIRIVHATYSGNGSAGNSSNNTNATSTEPTTHDNFQCEMVEGISLCPNSETGEVFGF